MEQQNNKPRYILDENNIPDNSILGNIHADNITTNGVEYNKTFVTEFAKMIARYFKDHPDQVQEETE